MNLSEDQLEELKILKSIEKECNKCEARTPHYYIGIMSLEPEEDRLAIYNCIQCHNTSSIKFTEYQSKQLNELRKQFDVDCDSGSYQGRK